MKEKASALTNCNMTVKTKDNHTYRGRKQAKQVPLRAISKQLLKQLQLI